MFHVITFILPEDAEDLGLAQQAPAMHTALCHLREAFRSHVKYDAPAVTQEHFFQILNEYNIDLDFSR